VTRNTVYMHTIETQRLHIRIHTYEEYINAFATCDDAALKAMFGFQNDADLQTQKSKISGGLTTYRTSVRFFHLILKETNDVAGGFAYHNWFPQDQRSEIGYDMKREEYKNKGYMKEAFPPIIAYGFETMGLNRMEAFIDPTNTPSRRLVEATGFQQEGLLKQRYRYNGVFSDALVYGLMVKDYRS
jgi:[ribosomal protein S5]-alanine N-acetyltransferase